MKMTDFSGNDQEDATLIMEGALTIERAAELKEMLLGAMRNSGSVVIRFMENSRIDISFLQLICAAHRSAINTGRNLKLYQNIPENLLKEIRSAGYAHHPLLKL
jgi:anti-anti-sigma regulatory factor